MAQTKATLIYVGDPMCSWCYGFSPEMDEVIKALPDSIDFKIVMGGLRPYNTETMLELGDFLHGHWTEVAHASGQAFKYDLLKDTSFVYDTEPPSRALVLFQEYKPEQTWEFFKAIQYAFYAENKNTNLLETYLPIVEKFGISPTDFKEKFESEALKEKTKANFTYAQEMGVRGFPTVLLEKGEERFIVTNGYTKAKNVLERINTD